MTEEQAFDYLYERAGRHGISVVDLLSFTPDQVSDCYIESAEFWDQRDISHIHPQSEFPELASLPSNMMPEDPSVNRSRGAEVMTDYEIAIAHEDNDILADDVDDDIDCDVELEEFPDVLLHI